MAYLYYTLVAVVLYLLSDWLLNRLEERVGRRFEYRSAIFFVIILVLSLSTFKLIETMMSPAHHAGMEQSRDKLPQ